MNAVDYSGYVLSAYGVSALLLLALGVRTALDARARERELKALEAAGLRRRSKSAS